MQQSAHLPSQRSPSVAELVLKTTSQINVIEAFLRSAITPLIVRQEVLY